MFKKILVPLDGSTLAEGILSQVMELAQIHKGEIILLRVALAHTFPGQDPIEHQVKVVREAEEYLANLEVSLKKAGVPVQTVVRYGHDAEEIIGHAKVHGCDLIAMSTHGRSGISLWVLGSVAVKVLHAAAVPVLLCRAC